MAMYSLVFSRILYGNLTWEIQKCPSILTLISMRDTFLTYKCPFDYFYFANKQRYGDVFSGFLTNSLWEFNMGNSKVSINFNIDFNERHIFNLKVSIRLI